MELYRRGGACSGAQIVQRYAAIGRGCEGSLWSRRERKGEKRLL